MVPGEWRSRPEHDVAVGRHEPPSSVRVPDFMAYFAKRYRLSPLGTAGRLMAMAAAHHRFNYIHPFPDGNGRVSRLMSHAMAFSSGIGAHGLWSISRGLSRGLENRAEYKAAPLLEEALIRGEFERGEIARITGLPERTARRVLKDVVDMGLLASQTPKGAVSLRCPPDALEVLFPKLFTEG